jgi:hypothetical protein
MGPTVSEKPVFQPVDKLDEFKLKNVAFLLQKVRQTEKFWYDLKIPNKLPHKSERH